MSCRRYKTAIIESLGHEPDDATAEHVRDCPNCAEFLAQHSATLDLYKHRPRRPSMPDEYWSQFWRTLESKLSSAPGRSVFRSIPLLHASLALTLVFAGVIIGITVARRDDPPVATVTEPRPLPVADVSDTPDARARQYLARTEMLLLSVANRAAADHTSDSLAVEKQLSERLLIESAMIQADLKRPEEQRLGRLLSDIDIVLMEIANYETGGGDADSGVFREGLDQRGLLFKINLEKMRMSRARSGGDI